MHADRGYHTKGPPNVETPLGFLHPVCLVHSGQIYVQKYLWKVSRFCWPGPTCCVPPLPSSHHVLCIVGQWTLSRRRWHRAVVIIRTQKHLPFIPRSSLRRRSYWRKAGETRSSGFCSTPPYRKDASIDR